MTVARFFIPTSLDEALGILREHGPDLLVMGGGTILMADVNEGRIFPRYAMSLSRAGLDGIRANGHLEVGATTPISHLTELGNNPLLAEAARQIGGPALRTMATIGGNLFAQPPHGDLGVPLLALDVKIVVTGDSGSTTLPLADFYAQRSDNSPAAGHLVEKILLDKTVGTTAYQRLGRRQANTPAVASVAIRVDLAEDDTCRDARVAIGSAGPFPMRVEAAEQVLVGSKLDDASVKATAEAAMIAADPSTDALATAWYRKRMVGLLVQRALDDIRSSIGGGRR
jgi:CO/xanthine dehydrogenase FAD-binding subunit